MNIILEAQTAKTGIGRPVTKMVETHIHPDKKLILHDFEGFHHGSATSTKNMKKLFMNLRGRGLPIDVVWFCWSASSHRVTQGQHARISEVQRMGIPVIGVLTKARVRAGQLHPNDRAFARVIEAEQLDLSEPSVYITSSVQDQAGEFEVGGHEILLQATTSSLSRTGSPPSLRVGDCARAGPLVSRSEIGGDSVWSRRRSPGSATTLPSVIARSG